MNVSKVIASAVLPMVAAGVLIGSPSAARSVDPPPGPPPGSTIKKYARQIVAAGAPGVQITTRDDGRVRSVVEGVGDLRGGEPPHAGRQFRIGSVTKTFTATVVLSLVDDGRIRLNAPIQRYLPKQLPYHRPITVRQLLEHRSGLFDYKVALWPTSQAAADSRYRDYTPSELIRIATQKPLGFLPGRKFRYANTDYVLLGMLVEKVTGHDYEHELWRRVLRPAQLDDTYVADHDPRLRRPAARGYEAVGSETRLTDLTRFNMSAAWASGDLVSTAADVHRFYGALLDGNLLSASSLHAMKQPKPAFPGFEYGLGLGHTEMCGQQIWGHVGGIPGYGTYTFTNGSAERQITVMANRSLTLGKAGGDAALAAVGVEFCGDSAQR